MDRRVFLAVLSVAIVVAGVTGDARAQGGAGGFAQDGNGRPAWAGGTGWTGQAGANATNAADDGGGGGGAGGGAGGAGSKGFLGGGGNGGMGGFNGVVATTTLANTGALAGTAGAAGASGDALVDKTGGGGGGAGGYGAVVTVGGASFNTGSIVAGNGGSGGSSQGSSSGGGFGGGGGVGVELVASGTTFTNSGTIVAGNGGSGGTGNGLCCSFGGGGGAGGIGVNFSGASGNVLINNGSIVAGTAGSGGSGSYFGGGSGATGAAGTGVVGANLTVVNSGTISGAVAIRFTGGTNMLMLQPGSNIAGNVVAFSGADTLALGGSGAGSFNVALVGSQYQNFGNFQVNSGTWTLANATSLIPGWQVNGGVLQVSQDGSLGAGQLTLNGGTLQTLASFSSSRSIALGSGSGTLAPAANTTLSLSGTIAGAGGLTMAGAGTLVLSGLATYNGPTSIQSGTVVTGSQSNTLSPYSAFTVSSGATLDLNGTTQQIASLAGAGTVTNGGSGTATLVTGGDNTSTTFSGTLQDGNGRLALTKIGSGTMVLTGANSYSGGTSVNGGTLVGNSLSLQGNIVNNAALVFDQTASGTFSGAISGAGSVTKTGAGTLYIGFVLGGGSSYSGATRIEAGRVHVTGGSNLLSPNSAFTLARGTVLDLGGSQQTVGSLAGSGSVTSTANGVASVLVTNGNNASTHFSGNLVDAGSSTLALVKTGTGALNLTGFNTYRGGTTVQAGILQGNSNSIQGGILNNSLLVFHQDIRGTYADSMSGAGAVHVSGGGQLTVTGSNTYTGPTRVFGTSLVVNGSLASSVTTDAASTLGGSGSIGGLTANGSTLQPGNSIGTLTVTGAMTQNGGTYQLEVNGQGQSDRIAVAGAAQLNGGTVAVQPLQGSYANSTTYTIVSAAGGLSGGYSGVTHNFAFLTPSLSYDASNAYLTLALVGPAPFSGGGTTPNQQAAGSALDQTYANASGDMATVIGALAGLDRGQGAAALEAINGHAWADFGTANLAGAAMFMNGVAQQMALARGGGSGAGRRQALAQACDVAACDGVSPFSVWGGVLGNTGSVGADGNAGTLTYTQGGAAAGIDYRIDPRFLVGLGVGYSSASMWVNNVQGKGWNNAVTASLYASFTEGGFYADVLAGYGWAGNQMQRQLAIPNLSPRVASGSASANQYLGQAEIGYRVPVWAPAQAAVTPFARLQAINVTQNAFSESGANALSLNVQQQATNALRSTLGAELQGGVPLGDRSLDLALRLGWQHEFAYTGRPITAAFAGAPSAAFTVYGVAPPRNAAVIGLQADTRVADAMQLYLRYDGELAGGADNHALTAGLRFSW